MLALKLYTKVHDIGTNREWEDSNVSKTHPFVKELESQSNFFNKKLTLIEDIIENDSKKNIKKHEDSLKILLTMSLSIIKDFNINFAKKFPIYIKSIISYEVKFISLLVEDLYILIKECRKTINEDEYFEPEEIHKYLMKIVINYEQMIIFVNSLKIEIDK